MRRRDQVDTGQIRVVRQAAAQVGIGAVRVYQWTIRPFIGSHCRFWPSCSEYAIEALRRARRGARNGDGGEAYPALQPVA